MVNLLSRSVNSLKKVCGTAGAIFPRAETPDFQTPECSECHTVRGRILSLSFYRLQNVVVTAPFFFRSLVTEPL